MHIASRWIAVLILAGAAACAAPSAADDGEDQGSAASKGGDLLASLQGKLTVAGTADTGAATIASSIAGVPLTRARALRFTGVTADASQLVSLELGFGRLDKKQFELLKAEFGGLSEVPHTATRDYSVIDFLPPVVQALVHRDYDATAGVTLPGTQSLRDGPGEDLIVSITPNCHGTAYEVARSYQQRVRPPTVSVLYGDAMPMVDAYDDTKLFKPLGAAKPGDDPARLLAQLRPGDLLAHRTWMDGAPGSLLHSAVYLGGGLVFEKPDTEVEGNETPYRLATYAQSKALVAAAVGDEPAILAFRAQNLTPAADLFALARLDKKLAQKLTSWATKKHGTLDKPLTIEYELGSGGGVRATHAVAIDVHKLFVGADGRGLAE